jgi:Domain of unknown function (DUF6265)
MKINRRIPLDAVRRTSGTPVCHFIFLTAVMFLLGLHALSASAQNASTPPPGPHESRVLPKPLATAGQFTWLQGRWKGTVATNTDDLTFMSAEEGSIAGVAVIHRDDYIYSVDLIHFVQTIQSVTVYLRHFSSELQPWEKGDPITLKFVSIHDGVSQFEGNFNGRPCSWNITQKGPDAFSIHSDMYDEKGEQQVMDFSFVRVKTLVPLMKSH